MSRIINTDSIGKQRNQQRRIIAEMLRRVSQKPQIDDEAKDMLAAMIYALQEIDEGIDVAVEAWEKRNYWNKADAFRQEWRWVASMEVALWGVLKEERWDDLPALMVRLAPYFADININKFMKGEDTWQGKYDELVGERGG
ncbi:MAG: hypothetical protein ACOYL5_03535 [Phototrophicaceae bacterium]|jgi:hypothetical protein